MNDFNNYFINSYDNHYDNSFDNFSRSFKAEDLIDKDTDFNIEDMNRFLFFEADFKYNSIFNQKSVKPIEEPKDPSKTEDITNRKNVENGKKKSEEIYLNEIKPKPEKSKKMIYKIFDIQKIKKENHTKGRMKGKLKKNYILHHTRFSQDNIIRKIKASFIEKCMNYINKEYRKYLKSQNIRKMSRLIQRILPIESRKIKKSENIVFFDTKLKDIFASPISKKCSLYDPNYNIRQINKLYSENKAKNVIKIFEMKINEMYYIFSYDVQLDGFETLKDDLVTQRDQMTDYDENEINKYTEEEINDYLSKYEYISQHLQQIFDEKKARKKKAQIK